MWCRRAPIRATFEMYDIHRSLFSSRNRSHDWLSIRRRGYRPPLRFMHISTLSLLLFGTRKFGSASPFFPALRRLPALKQLSSNV
ncbi:hypothetical protein GALMADRAFT_1061309 [Galerina marginata CBS 339.88]|uniref:Uncharacterized protein n=1 Tax=Galerina marginata (strain CBS 339.88) TaxID=685588 RepID=A0A067SJ59_GALM3|nr:hypothetical protein GALMADRAFT_1061309 [Galerina marginata CBS 339.88]